MSVKHKHITVITLGKNRVCRPSIQSIVGYQDSSGMCLSTWILFILDRSLRITIQILLVFRVCVFFFQIYAIESISGYYILFHSKLITRLFYRKKIKRLIRHIENNTPSVFFIYMTFSSSNMKYWASNIQKWSQYQYSCL